MKRIFQTKVLLILPLVLFSVLTCYGQDEQPDPLAGNWTKNFNGRTVTLSFSPDQKFQTDFTGDEGIDVWGRYELSGNRITFNDEGGDYSADVAGVYEFKADETSVTFTEVDDPLAGRKILMVGTWSIAGDAE